MFARTAAIERSDALILGGACVTTAAIVSTFSEKGLTLPILAFFGGIVFLAIVAGFLAAPWVTVPLVIPWFALTPTLVVFVDPLIGVTKDIISFAAITAAAVTVVRRRAARRPIVVDRVIVVLYGLIAILYLTNIGGNLSGETGYGAPWYQGVRLFCEPLSLLIVGLVLRQPRRTFDAAVRVLIGTVVVIALYGLAQQAIGVDGLLKLGYSYGTHVRQIGTHLRSFGTLDESFAYAATLLLGAGLILVTRRRSFATTLMLAVVTLGLLASFVRTAAIIAVGVVAFGLAQRGKRLAPIILLAASATAAAIGFVASSQHMSERAVPVSANTYLTLNGRTKLWKEQLGDHPSQWIFGRGVGATGTAADRAKLALGGRTAANRQGGSNTVDSGYFALCADVGVVGVILLLALFARLAAIARRAVSRGLQAGWAILVLLLVLMLDAVSRESFTGYPTAYIAFLLIGLATATALQAEASEPRHPAARSRGR